MIHFLMVLIVILEYLGMIIIEPERVSTPIVVVILLIHVMLFIWYSSKYPNKDKE